MNKFSYLMVYLDEEGEEDVCEIYAYSHDQAKSYAVQYCESHGWTYIDLEFEVVRLSV